MSNLQKKEQVDRLGQKIKDVGLFETLTNHDTVLLLDTSGSMYCTEVDGKKLVEHLKDAVREYVGQIEMVQFDDGAKVVNDLSTMKCGGMTKLLNGLRLCREMGAKTVMLVSDGLPSWGHKNESIAYCKIHNINVSYMFLGNDSSGIEFMKKISSETGGKYAGNVDVQIEGFGQRLISGVRGLIEERDKKGDGDERRG